jgi:tetratricopeptide (TPR) repeat protein
MAVSDADRARAGELHELARTLDAEGSLSMYRQVLVLDPNRPTTLYNMGLIFKYQGKWQESFSHNREAADLYPNDEAINWNLGIAATALRDWRTARDVWKRLGMEIESGDTPIESNFGVTPVRLNPGDGGEVVWSRRIDPVRARITSVPYGGSGYRRGDVVLHGDCLRRLDDQRSPTLPTMQRGATSRTT